MKMHLSISDTSILLTLVAVRVQLCAGAKYTCTMNTDNFCVFEGVRIESAQEAQDAILEAPVAPVLGIKFRESHLQVLPERLYGTFPALQELRVWWQHLHSIHVDANLVKLDAERNRITTITVDQTAVPKLRILELGQNRLRSLENISCFENLDTLELGNNELRTVDLGVFHRMHHLRLLDLSANKMSIVRNSMEGKLPSLKLLYLNDNRLTYLDMAMLGKFPGLETVQLVNNALMYLEYENLRTVLPRVNVLQIAGNDWHCENLAEMVLHFKQVNIKEYKLFNAVKCKERIVDGICCSDSRPLAILRKSNLYFSNYANELGAHQQHLLHEVQQAKHQIRQLIAQENFTQTAVQLLGEEVDGMQTQLETMAGGKVGGTGVSSRAAQRHRPRGDELDKLSSELAKVRREQQQLASENQTFKGQLRNVDGMQKEMQRLRDHSEQLAASVQVLQEENVALRDELARLLVDFQQALGMANRQQVV